MKLPFYFSVLIALAALLFAIAIQPFDAASGVLLCMCAANLLVAFLGFKYYDHDKH